MEDESGNSTAPVVDAEDSTSVVENQLAESAESTETAETVETPNAPQEQSTPVEEPAQDKKSLMVGLFLKWKEKMFGRKQARLQKIMDLADKKKKIKAEDVRNLLVVSRPTATRYLDELVKQGKLKVAGKSVQTEYEPV